MRAFKCKECGYVNTVETDELVCEKCDKKEENLKLSIDEMLEIVGTNRSYFKKIFEIYEQCGISEFNWAAFFLGPVYCVYRGMSELGIKRFLLFYILLFLVMLSTGLFSSKILEMILYGDFLVFYILAALSIVVSVVALILAIKVGKEFNKEYYYYCLKMASAKKQGHFYQEGPFLGKAVELFCVILILNAILICSTVFLGVKNLENLYFEDDYDEYVDEDMDYYEDDYDEDDYDDDDYETDWN